MNSFLCSLLAGRSGRDIAEPAPVKTPVPISHVIEPTSYRTGCKHLPCPVRFSLVSFMIQAQGRNHNLATAEPAAETSRRKSRGSESNICFLHLRNSSSFSPSIINLSFAKLLAEPFHCLQLPTVTQNHCPYPCHLSTQPACPTGKYPWLFPFYLSACIRNIFLRNFPHCTSPAPSD